MLGLELVFPRVLSVVKEIVPCVYVYRCCGISGYGGQRTGLDLGTVTFVNL